MSKISKSELKDKRAELETEVNELQDNLAKKTYSVNLESMSNLKAILKQIDKSYTWSIKNAALVISLYDNLNNAKIAIQKSEDDSFVVELKAMDLNTLYQVLTNIEGTGIEAAKTFTRLLTNVGKQITDAMNQMSDSNKEIQSKHVALAELDSKIEELTKQESAEELQADEIN